MQLRFKFLLDITPISIAKLTYELINSLPKNTMISSVSQIWVDYDSSTRVGKSTKYELSTDADITETPTTDYNHLCTGVKNVSLQKVNNRCCRDLITRKKADSIRGDPETHERGHRPAAPAGLALYGYRWFVYKKIDPTDPDCGGGGFIDAVTLRPPVSVAILTGRFRFNRLYNDYSC